MAYGAFGVFYIATMGTGGVAGGFGGGPDRLYVDFAFAGFEMAEGFVDCVGRDEACACLADRGVMGGVAAGGGKAVVVS